MFGLEVDLVVFVVHVLSDEHLDFENRRKYRAERDLCFRGHLLLEEPLHIVVVDRGRVLRFGAHFVLVPPDGVVAAWLVGVDAASQALDFSVDYLDDVVRQLLDLLGHRLLPQELLERLHAEERDDAHEPVSFEFFKAVVHHVDRLANVFVSCAPVDIHDQAVGVADVGHEALRFCDDSKSLLVVQLVFPLELFEFVGVGGEDHGLGKIRLRK